MVHPKINKHFNRISELAFLLPLILLCLFFTYSSLEGPLHDYSNNYFPALLVKEGIAPESVLFDIFDFNSYIWEKGYAKELTDFYLNSPFTSTFFYPFAFIENAYYAKLLFNLICSFFLVLSVKTIGQSLLSKKEKLLLFFLPFLFYIPLKNNILFGQLYLLITAFILLGYHYIKSGRAWFGASLISLSIFIKLFPLFYCIPLLYDKKWKSIFSIFIISLILFGISIYIGGWSFWKTYLFDILPNAISNESTVDFRSNAQSLDVFFKTLFVHDAYYNPRALFNNVIAFKIIVATLKAFIFASALVLSFKHKSQLFRVLSIWVVALFLTQTRTATYAQILWLIPAIEIVKSTLQTKWKITFFCLLLLVCNFPFHWLRGAPLLFEFSRLWLSITIAYITFYCFGLRLNVNFTKVFLTVLIPLVVLASIKKVAPNTSEYVLQPNTLFMVYDFYVEDEQLVYQALGKNGRETIPSTIKVESLDREACYIVNNQVFYKNNQLTNNSAIKKKPVLVNGCDVYYLTDHHSRRGAFTLKRIHVCL